MKDYSYNSGFSTLEILIAFAVMTLSLTAVIMVAFGNQSTAISTELAQRALYLAEQKLEIAGARAQTDLNASFADLNETGPLYTTTISSFADDCSVSVKSTVSWSQGLRNLDTVLSSVFVNPDEFTGVVCDPGGLSSDWDTPDTYNSEDLSPGGNSGTGLDILTKDGHAYILLTSTHGPVGSADFWIFNVDDPSNIIEESALNVGLPLNDVAVPANGDYAYVVSTDPTAQLQVIDINPVASPSVVATYALPDIDPGGSYPAGYSIYYYDDPRPGVPPRLFIGTKETGGTLIPPTTGPEFHIYDLSIPSSPVHVGKRELTHNVNSIVVRDDLAYLATSDNTGELMIIDISNPGSLLHPDATGMKYDVPGSNQDATSIFLRQAGTELVAYLGLQRQPGDGNALPDFYMLDVDTPTAINPIGSQDIGLLNNSAITGISIQSFNFGEQILAFLVTSVSNAGFQIWDITDESNIHLATACSIYNYSEKAVDFIMYKNKGYVANESNDALRIIDDSPDICTP